MSDNYALDKQMERLQQEVAELRNGQIVAAVSHAELDGIVRELSDRLAALERPAAATADPVCAACGGDGKAKYERSEDVTFHRCQVCAGTGHVTPAQPAPAEGIDVERVMDAVDQYAKFRAQLEVLSCIHNGPPSLSQEREMGDKLTAIRAMLGGAR